MESRLQSFVRAKVSLPGSSGSTKDSIQCLPDLVRFNAVYNPDHLFGIQSNQVSPDSPLQFTRVTFLQLAHAVERCCDWILAHVPEASPAKLDRYGSISKSRPVALFMESDLGLFIYLTALLTLNIPVSFQLTEIALETTAYSRIWT